MNYRVIWRTRVMQRVGLLYVFALELGRNPGAITYAFDEIDHLLQNEPSAVGESREDRERVLIVNPLTVKYEVFEDTKTVLIYELISHDYPHHGS